MYCYSHSMTHFKVSCMFSLLFLVFTVNTNPINQQKTMKISLKTKRARGIHTQLWAAATKLFYLKQEKQRLPSTKKNKIHFARCMKYLMLSPVVGTKQEVFMSNGAISEPAGQTANRVNYLFCQSFEMNVGRSQVFYSTLK
jgi:hypothetical protein